jgi:hypothetical protein
MSHDPETGCAYIGIVVSLLVIVAIAAVVGLFR